MLMFAAALILLIVTSPAVTIPNLRQRTPRRRLGIVPAGLGRTPCVIVRDEVLAVRDSAIDLLHDVEVAVSQRIPLDGLQLGLQWDRLYAALVAVGADDALVDDLDRHFELARRLETIPAGLCLLDTDAATISAMGVLGDRVARRTPVLVGRVVGDLGDLAAGRSTMAA